MYLSSLKYQRWCLVSSSIPSYRLLGEVIAEVANGTTEDVALAVTAAHACMNSTDWGYASTGIPLW